MLLGLAGFYALAGLGLAFGRFRAVAMGLGGAGLLAGSVVIIGVWFDWRVEAFMRAFAVETAGLALGVAVAAVFFRQAEALAQARVPSEG